MLFLLWVYHSLRAMLCGMKYGDGFPAETINQLRADLFMSEFDERNPSWSDTREEVGTELESLIAGPPISHGKIGGEIHNDAGRELVLEDWAARLKSSRMPMSPEPKRFARLMHGVGIEKLRQFIN